MAVTKQNLEKQDAQRAECHKMLCRCCGTRFCFKCLAVLTESHTCGCSRDAHGFIDPHTGRRLAHLRAGRRAIRGRPATVQDKAADMTRKRHAPVASLGPEDNLTAKR